MLMAMLCPGLAPILKQDEGQDGAERGPGDDANEGKEKRQHRPGRGDGHWNGKATHENQQKKKRGSEAFVPLNTALGCVANKAIGIGVYVDVDGVFVILRCNAMFGQRESLWRYRRQRVRFNARTLRSHVQGVGFVDDGLLQTPIFGGAP